METWEMIKELTENPKKEYISNRPGGEFKAKVNPNGIFEVTFNDTKQMSFALDREWEEVKVPVTWQEAIQATIEGKTIIIEHNGRKYTQKGYEKIGCLHFEDYTIADITGFNRDLFTKGKWYIED